MDTPVSFNGLDEGQENIGDRQVQDMGTLPPRLRVPDRSQMRWEPWSLEGRLADDHPARTVWAVVCGLDLSAFEATVAARGETPGRPATDPRLLVALWLYAAIEGVGRGRELERLCQSHDAYRWLCGDVEVNYHTLNDFRVGHEKALDELLTRMLATLMHQGLVSVKRISQDGTKVRASAGVGSFKSRGKLEELLEAAKDHVATLKDQPEESSGGSAQRRATRLAAAEDRRLRVESALTEMKKLEEAKAKEQKKKPGRERGTARISTTDPEARKMKMPDGGFSPAYNVQIATDPSSRAIVGIEVTNHGTDHGEDQPLRRQVEARTGQKVGEQLVDGGYVKRESIEEASKDGVTIYAPLPALGPGGSVVIHREGDSPAVASWRQRMQTPEGRAVYRERASTSETVNADLKEFRGMGRFVVRGLTKVKCVALWSALAYNVMHFAQALSCGIET